MPDRDPTLFALPQVLEAEWRQINQARGLNPIETSASNAVAGETGTDYQLRSLYHRIHKHDPHRAALCLSGGGIRSATFNLGVIQGLARAGLLKQFQYLSTVSGGGYIGGWFSAWIHREGIKNHGSGFESVIEKLRNEHPSPLNPEPQRIRHLRDYSNYLSPRLGILSADTWTLVAIFFRNLLLNWLIIVPALALLLMAPRICAWNVQRWLDGSHPTIVCAELGVLVLVGTLLQVWTLAALDRHGIVVRAPREAAAPHGGPNPRIIRYNQMQFLTQCWLPLLTATVCLTTAWVSLNHLLAKSDLRLLVGFILFQVLTGAAATILNWLLIRRGVAGTARAGAAADQPAPATPAADARSTDDCAESDRDNVPAHWRVAALLVSGALVGWLTWTFANLGGERAQRDYPLLYVTLASPLYLLSFVLGGAVYHGMLSRWTRSENLEWSARAAGWALIAAAAWASLAAITLFGPSLLIRGGTAIQTTVGSAGGIAALATALLSKSSKTPANREQAAKLGPIAFGRQLGLAVAAPLFVIVLFIALSLLTDWLVVHWDPPKKIQELAPPSAPVIPAATLPARNGDGSFTVNYESESAQKVSGPWLTRDRLDFNEVALLYGHIRMWALWSVVFVVLVLAASYFVNVNRFSLHGAYRNRLIRAYLGAWRMNESTDEKTRDPFTGFDPCDDLPMYELNGNKLFHVINIALNLVHGGELAWQQRKAESFTVSALHCGNSRLGYRSTQYYGGSRRPGRFRLNRGGDVDPKRAISLGSAMAVSGAAASPNMGYHSSPFLTFLMTLFNVRLGAWLGNPGMRGAGTWDKASPDLAFLPLLQEAFGLTDDQRPWVNLSDGGHFENLGIYEMVRRRCHLIVASDASADPTVNFADLGNAVRKIGIDMGVPIEFRGAIPIYPRKGEKIGSYCALGKIRYTRVDGIEAKDGDLVYIKPAFYGAEPIDVYNYARGAEAFPHETTADQFFTESQLESYRALGSHVVERMSGASEGGLRDTPMTVDEFLASAAEHIRKQAEMARSSEANRTVPAGPP